MRTDGDKSKVCVLFKGARDVIKADKIARDMGLIISVMPVPENLSSECGMCLIIKKYDLKEFHNMLENKGIHAEFCDLPSFSTTKSH
ncbi:MAG: DUF3343 domain-containing protein [Bacteroidales bacterium]